MIRPETPVVVLFQEVPAPSLPVGIEAKSVSRFTDEADLWQWALDYGIQQNWDWCMVVHDDFKMLDSGWEDIVEKSEDWRVALASWYCYARWDESATSCDFTRDPLAVCFDPMAWGWKVDIFRRRGCITNMRHGFSYAAWETNAWALSEGYAIWNIPLRSSHQWIPNEHTRYKLGVEVSGHPQLRDQIRGHITPASVKDQEHIEIGGRCVRVAPGKD